MKTQSRNAVRCHVFMKSILDKGKNKFQFCYVCHTNCNSRFGKKLLRHEYSTNTFSSFFRSPFPRRFCVDFLSSFVEARVEFWLRISAFFYAQSIRVSYIFSAHEERRRRQIFAG